MWSAARVDLGLTDEEFLLISPTALSALFDRSLVRRREERFGFAMVCAEIWNVNNNWDKNPEGFSPDQFMPGAKSDAEEFDELAEEVEQNRLSLPEPKDLEAFRRRSSKMVVYGSNNRN